MQSDSLFGRAVSNWRAPIIAILLPHALFQRIYANRWRMIESRNPMKHLCRLANLCVTRRHATTAERSAFSSLKPNLPFRFHSLFPRSSSIRDSTTKKKQLRRRERGAERRNRGSKREKDREKRNCGRWRLLCRTISLSGNQWPGGASALCP